MTDELARLRELSEKATAGEWTIWPERISGADAAKAELIDQVDNTTPIVDHLYLLSAEGKCPATTGCGPTSGANAVFIAACVNYVRAALRDAPAPKADAGKVDRCPTCRAGWTLFKPAKCHGSDHVRCIECKAVYPLSIVAASALPALTDPQGREA